MANPETDDRDGTGPEASRGEGSGVDKTGPEAICAGKEVQSAAWERPVH